MWLYVIEKTGTRITFDASAGADLGRASVVGGARSAAIVVISGPPNVIYHNLTCPSLKRVS